MRTGFSLALLFIGWLAAGCGVGVFPNDSSTQLDAPEVAVDRAEPQGDAPSTVDLAIQIMARDDYPLLRPQANVFVRVVGGSGETLFDGQTDAMGRVPSVFRVANAPFSVTAGRRDLGLISVVGMTNALSHPIAFALPRFQEVTLIVRPPARAIVRRARVLSDDPQALFSVSTNDCGLDSTVESPRLFERECIEQVLSAPTQLIVTRSEYVGAQQRVFDAQFLEMPAGPQPLAEIRFNRVAALPQSVSIPIETSRGAIFGDVARWELLNHKLFVHSASILGRASIGNTRIDVSNPQAPRFVAEYWGPRPNRLSFHTIHDGEYGLYVNTEIAAASPVFRLPTVVGLELQGRRIEDLRFSATGTGFSRLLLAMQLGTGQSWRVIDASGTLRELRVPGLPAGMSQADLQGPERSEWGGSVVQDGRVPPWDTYANAAETACSIGRGGFANLDL